MAVPVPFSQQVLGSLCYLLSVISPDSTITHTEGSYQALCLSALHNSKRHLPQSGAHPKHQSFVFSLFDYPTLFH